MNYDDVPKSVTEIRGDKSGSASMWTPRDALISALREIDSKRLDPFVAFVALGSLDKTEDKKLETFTKFFAAGPNNYVVQGVAMRALYMFNED